VEIGGGKWVKMGNLENQVEVRLLYGRSVSGEKWKIGVDLGLPQIL